MSIFSKSVKKNTTKPVVLLMLDGFGIAPESSGNPIASAPTPNLDMLREKYLYGLAIAAGESVGLPANEAGNSEVGHLTVGAGRVVDQSLVRINKSIEDKSFFTNDSFLNALNHVRTNKSRLHIMGMVGGGSVHSSNIHLMALLEFCDKNNAKNVCLHLFTDGRDSSPTTGIYAVEEIDKYLKERQLGRICTIAGRYFAMDRDARWERTKKMYDVLTLRSGSILSDAVGAVSSSYNAGKTDEFIEPVVIGEGGAISDNDAVIFFNFRIDRPRQLTMAFVLPEFEKMKGVEFGYVPHEKKTGIKATDNQTFTREIVLNNLYFVTMTEYQKNLPVSDIAFPPPIVKNSISEVISDAGLKQFHLAESEKERMVAFYMDGLREEPYPGEDVKIVPSPNVATYDKKPEMSVKSIVKEFIKAVRKDEYSYFAINFANPDMVAHSGKLDATIEAIKATDMAVGEVVEETLFHDGIIVITADHGNAEELLTYSKSGFYFTTEGGEMNTEHSNNPVPVYIAGNNLENKSYIIDRSISKYDFKGALQDIAPTVLKLMNIPIPMEMRGRDLLSGVKKSS